MVVQLAFEDGCAIVDPLALPDLSPLAGAFAQTTAVGHALPSDLKIFADRFDRVPGEVFDCQVAGSFLGYGMAISLADLVRDLCGIRLKKSQTVSDWSARPFSDRQLEYLVDDGAHLLDICTALTERTDEDVQMATIVKRLAQSVEAPLVIDSTEPKVIEAALTIYAGRAVAEITPWNGQSASTASTTNIVCEVSPL